MDWVTQAAVGAAVAEIMLGKRMGNSAPAWGAALGVAPDLLEGVAGLFLSHSAQLDCDHGLTHALWWTGLAVTTLPRWLVRKWKRHKVTQKDLSWTIGTILVIHGLVDTLGGPGVAWLWPFPLPRLAANVLGAWDVWFTTPLALAMLALSRFQAKAKKVQQKRRRLWWWGVGLSSSYLALALTAKWTASAAFGADLARRGIACERRMESPTPSNILLWRGLAVSGDQILLGYRSVFEWPGTPVRWSIIPRQSAALGRYATTREASRVANFCNGWWIARDSATGLWLADLRSGENRVWGERKGMVDYRIRRAWHLEPSSQGDPLHPLVPASKTRQDMTRRMAWRTVAQRDQWEAQPRLAGLPGAFPEPLEVAE